MYYLYILRNNRNDLYIGQTSNFKKDYCGIIKQMDITIRQYQSGDEVALAELIQADLLQINSKDYTPAMIERMCEKFTPEKK